MIEDDLRLVSMVELAVIRERAHNKLSHAEAYSGTSVYAILHETNEDFERWYNAWDTEFSKHYEDVTFSRQSLEVQRHFAELFHNATALRGIRGPDDVAQMPPEQRALAMRSIHIAKAGLDICLRSASYRTGLKYGMCPTNHIPAEKRTNLSCAFSRTFHACQRNFCCQFLDQTGAVIVSPQASGSLVFAHDAFAAPPMWTLEPL